MTIHKFCTTGYTIADHPNPELVYDWMRGNWHDLYSWQGENIDSLKGFCDEFNLSGMDYAVSTCSYSYATANIQDEDIAALSGVRLFKYIQNNHNLDKLLSGNCPFTGYCFDENLLDNIRSFIQSPDKRNFQELINDCLHDWVKTYIADWEYTYTDEALQETCERNEYYFDENGNFVS